MRELESSHALKSFIACAPGTQLSGSNRKTVSVQPSCDEVKTQRHVTM
jgi:hypothetical protein